MSTEVKQTKPYGIGLDILRVMAMFFVIMVHSTTFYGFYDEGVNSIGNFFAAFSRYLSYTCVPIFLLLTGYLNCHKTPTLRYYLKLIRFIIEYVISGVIVFAFNKLFTESPMSFGNLISGLFNFTFPSYSWYVDMFIGLFLIAPFLNYILKALTNKQKLIFVIVLIFAFSNFKISPWWSSAYPLIYYFIGAILRDTKINIKKPILFVVASATVLTQILLFKFPYIPRYSVENYFNIGCIIIAVSVFLLLYDIKIDEKKKVLITPLRMIANTSLATYLVSEIFETLTAQYFEKIGAILYSDRLPYLLYLTPLKFILSVICGILIHLAATYIFKIIQILIDKFAKKTQKTY